MARCILAILAGFLGTIIGAVVRNFILSRGAGLGTGRFPHADAGDRLCRRRLAGGQRRGARGRAAQRSVGSPVWIGTLAGLFAAILMAMLMITYYTNPGETPKLRR